MNNQMGMNNIKNNQMGMNNMMNNQMMMNNPMMINNPLAINNPMGMNNMMNNQMMMNDNINNPMIINNQMNINNNMMNNQMMLNNPMIMNDQMGMNKIINPFPKNKQMQINNKMKKDKNSIISEENQKIHRRKYNGKRKVPPILQKNANRKIESITFQVEKGLKISKSPFLKRNIQEIFRNLFKKRKQELNEKGELVNLKENEPLEILHYKFDTDSTKIFNVEKKSLIQGLSYAYKNHFPITVSPDMIWLLILQGFSRFMDKYSELVREKFVNFEGQKTLFVNRYGLFFNQATEEDWNGIIDEFVEQIGEHIGEKTILNLQSDFTTTNAVTLVVSQTSIMSAMKHYFSYEVIGGGCGISYITLEGSLEDWEKIKSKLKYLSKYALEWWTKHLIPIIDNIIKTKKYYNENKKINSELVSFWKNMIKIKDKEHEYFPDIFNGWIIKFLPNLTAEHPKLYEELHEMEIPDQIISCPLKLLEDRSDGFKVVYNCDVASGFFGMIQDKKILSVKPVIGYAIVVEKKETSPLTKEDKEEIIKNYFS